MQSLTCASATDPRARGIALKRAHPGRCDVSFMGCGRMGSRARGWVSTHEIQLLTSNRSSVGPAPLLEDRSPTARSGGHRRGRRRGCGNEPGPGLRDPHSRGLRRPGFGIHELAIAVEGGPGLLRTVFRFDGAGRAPPLAAPTSRSGSTADIAAGGDRIFRLHGRNGRWDAGGVVI